MSEPTKNRVVIFGVTIGEWAALISAICMIAIAAAHWSRNSTIIIERQKAAQKAAMEAAQKP